MNMHACVIPEKMNVICDLLEVLPALDAVRDFIIETLDADLELKGTRRELHNQLAQTVRQSIRNHFKMQEQARSIAREEEFQDRLAHGQVQVERPIDELELVDATIEQT